MSHRIHTYRQTQAVIHLPNLVHNFRKAVELNGPNPFICPMVKANAYGHGDVEIALELEKAGARHLGLGLVEEAVLLRQMGVQCELLVYGIFDHHGAEEVFRQNLTPVLSTWEQIEALEKVAAHFPKRRLPIHLKFDTGMHRLGFSVSDSERLFIHLRAHPSLELRGICTHLASGEDANDLSGDSFRQLQFFQSAVDHFAPMKLIVHALNSAALINLSRFVNQGREWPRQLTANYGSRPGLLIYGYSPFQDEASLGLKPVMSLRSHIVKYHFLKKGERVSYGGTWTAPQDSIIGVVPIGYADGYHRSLTNKAEVLFRGQRVAQVGNVCMDYIMLDLTGRIARLEVETHKEFEVTLFGQDPGGQVLSAHELAQKAQTIAWEILTSVGERVPRVFERET